MRAQAETPERDTVLGAEEAAKVGGRDTASGGGGFGGQRARVSTNVVGDLAQEADAVGVGEVVLSGPQAREQIQQVLRGG